MQNISTSDNSLLQIYSDKFTQTYQPDSYTIRSDLLERFSSVQALSKKNSVLLRNLSNELFELDEKFKSSNKYISFEEDFNTITLSPSSTTSSLSSSTSFSGFSLSTLSSHNSTTSKSKSSSLIKLNEIAETTRKFDNETFPKIIDEDNKIIIGPNGTILDKKFFDSLSWTSASAVTRKILSNIFDIKTLATHSLTGKPSPAFHGRERPPKNQLDQKKISDIIYLMTHMCNTTEKEVRTAITTKCADTTKRFKQQQLKKTTSK